MSEFRQFDAYRREYAENYGSHDYCDMDYLLRFWRQNKGEYLTRMFNDQLILERPIEYKADRLDLEHNMDDALISVINDLDLLRHALKKAMHVEDFFFYNENDNDRLYNYLCNNLTHSDLLIANQINLSVLLGKPSYALDINGHKIILQDGQKVTRVWTSLAKALGLEDAWERVRIIHAQVMNQQTLKGTLCLSIHPLDYATASDNENNWSSCMSWRDGGCYRLGTVEMMNSPMVICAYLKSNKQFMSIDNKPWNSKKWRAWILVNDKVILCNRHYPYHQTVFARQACEWVRELAEKACGWHYGELQNDLIAYINNNDYNIRFTTNHMYNDIGGNDCIGMLDTTKVEPHTRYIINFSGPAECMVCGDEIGVDGNGIADGLTCETCRGVNYCSVCGCTIEDGDEYYGPDDTLMCPDCYDERCCECDECGSIVWRDDTTVLTMPVYKKRAKTFIHNHPILKPHFSCWGSLWLPTTMPEKQVCECCVKDYKLIECSWPDDNENGNIQFNYPIVTIDPRTTDADTIYKLFKPDGWYYAHSKYSHMSKEEAQTMIEYYYDQYEAFKEDIIHNENMKVKRYSP